MKLLPVVIGLKLGLILAAGAVWAALETGLDKKILPSRALESSGTAGKNAGPAEASGKGASALPEIPAPGAGLTDYNNVRMQLETMRQDVEEKLVRLRMATQSLEAVRADAQEKLTLARQDQQLLQETLQKEKTVKKERIEEALAFVEKMEPRKAAPVLEAMDRDLVIELFKLLKPKTVTKFLEAMKPRKATEYMEYYTRIRSGREYELLRDLRVCSTSEIPDQPAEEGSVRPQQGETEVPAQGGTVAPGSGATGGGQTVTPAAPDSPVAPSAGSAPGAPGQG